MIDKENEAYLYFVSFKWCLFQCAICDPSGQLCATFCALEMLILIIMQIHQKVSTFVWKLNRKKELKWSMSGCNVVGNGKEIYSSWNWSIGLSMSRPSNAKRNQVKRYDWITNGKHSASNMFPMQDEIAWQIFSIENVIWWLLKAWDDIDIVEMCEKKRNGNNFASFLKNFDRFS